MHWNSSRNTNEQKAGTRQRLLAILAAQGVLTEALFESAHDDSDDDVLEIEITDFEGCLGDDDDDIAGDADGAGDGDGELDELDDGRVEFDRLKDEAEEDADEVENEASGSRRRPATAERPDSSRQQGDRRAKKRQSQ
jgi:hypothetical protein